MRRCLVFVALSWSASGALGQPAPRNEALDRMVARLLPLARGVSAQFDDVQRAVRRDSGTARADSAAFRFWRRPWLVTRRLDQLRDHEITVTIEPDASLPPEASAPVRRATAGAERDSLVRLLASHGIRTSLLEGVIYYELSAAHFERLMSCCVTDAMREYVSMERTAQEHRAASDGSLMVPLDDIVQRMIRAEDFLARHPGSVAAPQVTYERDRYLYWVIFGIDNSPAFNFRTREVLPAYRAAMERLASERASERSGKAAQEMLDLLKANGYRRTPAVEEHIRQAFNSLRPPR